MHLLILGASGGCGSELTRLAVARGHRVSALIRPESKFQPPPQVQVHRGEILEDGVVERALSGVDAVMCCIGIRRRNPNNPWSTLISPPDLCERVARILVDALPRAGVDRLIAISAAGVGDSAARMSGLLSWLFDHSNVGIAYRDLAKMESALARSVLDWMAVRPATLSYGRLRENVREIDFYGVFSKISRADVANWMLHAAEQPRPFKYRTPMIGY